MKDAARADSPWWERVDGGAKAGFAEEGGQILPFADSGADFLKE